MIWKSNDARFGKIFMMKMSRDYLFGNILQIRLGDTILQEK